MSKDCVHANSLSFRKKGVRCILCNSILKQRINSTTTKGCITCGVPLCSAMSSKFKVPEDSCEYRWHNVFDLDSLEALDKNKNRKKRVGSLQQCRVQWTHY